MFLIGLLEINGFWCVGKKSFMYHSKSGYFFKKIRLKIKVNLTTFMCIKIGTDSENVPVSCGTLFLVREALQCKSNGLIIPETFLIHLMFSSKYAGSISNSYCSLSPHLLVCASGGLNILYSLCFEWKNVPNCYFCLMFLVNVCVIIWDKLNHNNIWISGFRLRLCFMLGHSCGWL